MTERPEYGFYAPFHRPPDAASEAGQSTVDGGVAADQDLTAYVAKVADGVVRAPDGTRNDVLNRAAFTLGRIVAASQLTAEQVTAALTEAGNMAGLDPAEIRATIRSGLNGGAAQPRALEPALTVPAVTVLAAEPQALELRRARITWADQIEPEPVVWALKEADQGRIPAGSLSVAAGREGTGKSSFATWLTAQITKGTLPGSHFGTPRRVFYVAVEDSWKHTIVPRLMAAGADLGRVGRFDVVNIYDKEIMLSLPADNAMLAAAIVENEVALVVIDSLLSAIGETISTHQSREVRSALDPLARIADRTDSVLLGIAHFNKGTGTDPSSLITGSGAFKVVPRTVFGFVRDDSDDKDVRIMTQTKNTLAPEGPSLSYQIEQAVISTKLGAAITSRFVLPERLSAACRTCSAMPGRVRNASRPLMVDP